MVELGIASYLFGKTADFVYDSFYDKFDVKNNLNKKKLRKFIENFKSEILKRHKENPDFEEIENFWSRFNVVEELFAICYLRTSKFDTYLQFRKELEQVVYNMNRDLCFSLMDQFEHQLKNTIEDISSFTEADIAVIRSILTDSLKSFDKVAELKFKKSDLNPYDTDIDEYIILCITGGFENNMRSPFKVENFDDNRVDISTLILNKNVDKLKLENKYEYIKIYEQIKEMFEAINSEDDNYENLERAFVDARKEVLNFERKLDKVYRCIQLYFHSPVSRTNVIATPTDLKNFIEIMLNRSGVATSGKKYQFFVDRNDGMYFNVYLSNEEIDYVKKQDSTVLLYARMGGDLVMIQNFSKKAQLKIISELLLNLVDKQNISKRHYVIGNYFIAEG